MAYATYTTFVDFGTINESIVTVLVYIGFALGCHHLRDTCSNGLAFVGTFYHMRTLSGLECYRELFWRFPTAKE